MTVTYDKIATTTLASDNSTVTFSSISGSYTDLVLISSIIGSGSQNEYNAAIRFNSDTGSNYSRTTLAGNGSAAQSVRSSNATSGLLQATGYYSTEPTTIITNIQNYSNSTTYKTVISRASYASSSAESTVNLWRNTAAITELTLILAAGSYRIGSTFTLYGIKAE